MRGLRRTGDFARVLRAKLLTANALGGHRAVAAAPALALSAAFVFAGQALRAGAVGDSRALDDALARAAGNRRPAAVRLGQALFSEIWPVQISKVRIDGAGAHLVAGLVLSGRKFHHSVDAAAFTEEVVAVVERTFAASAVEEVDVWATLPLQVAPHTVVAGDYAQPTSRIVYSATVRRSERGSFAARLRRGDDVFWDPAWKRTLASGSAS